MTLEVKMNRFLMTVFGLLAIALMLLAAGMVIKLGIHNPIDLLILGFGSTILTAIFKALAD